jgi:hypothetical protein
MNTQFKYQRALKFAELSYYCYGQEKFVQYFNGFLEEFDLEMKEAEEKTFENCLNFLNSISHIMVERFLCAYHFYYERGQKPIMDGFCFYNLNKLKWFDKPSVTMRIISPTPYTTTDTALIISLNKDGIFYSNKPKNWSLFKLLNKPEEDSRYFINVKDLGEYLSRTTAKLTKNEIKDIQSFYKTIIGKPIEKSYELC